MKRCVLLFILIQSALLCVQAREANGRGIGISEQRQQLNVVYDELRRAVRRDYDLSLLPRIRVFREQAKSFGDVPIIIDSYLLEGALFEQYGAYKDALVMHFEALALAEKSHDEQRIIDVYFAFVELEVELERFDAAERYLHKISKALQRSQIGGTPTYLLSLWQAQILQFKGSYREVVAKMRPLFEQTNLPDDLKAKVTLLYARGLLSSGEFEAARRALLEVKSLQQVYTSKEQIEYQILLAKCHLQAGEFYQAELLATKELQQTFDTRYLTEQGELQQILANAHVQQQQYKQAHLYIQRALMTERAINLQKRSNKVLQLEAQFSVAQQKQQLNVLERDNAQQAQKLERQQQQLENARLTQQRWILLALLLFGVGGFLYWRWQNKRYLIVLKQQVQARTAELAERNERLQALSFTDSLTGIRNRHYFFSVIDGFITQTKQRESVLCLVDIDHFKRINDTYGHAAGDVILQRFAEILKQCTRRSDIVVRWGGEEFLLLMPDMSRQEACEVAERIRLQVSSYPFVINDHILTCTCSIGFAPLPLVPERDKWLNWEQTLELADVGLYIAKETRRNAWMGIAQLVHPEAYQNAEVFSKQARVLIRSGELKVFASHSQVMLET
ncbi:tetratricopeptide repeat-containing diguanylate cyclase [Pseudoalteromonas xiamenensis]